MYDKVKYYINLKLFRSNMNLPLNFNRYIELLKSEEVFEKKRPFVSK